LGNLKASAWELVCVRPSVRFLSVFRRILAKYAPCPEKAIDW
jgi:hypothetical protein